jgi:hypothetical protein
MVLSGEAAEVFSCGCQPADSGTTPIIQPRSGDSGSVAQSESIVSQLVQSCATKEKPLSFGSLNETTSHHHGVSQIS